MCAHARAHKRARPSERAHAMVKQLSSHITKSEGSLTASNTNQTQSQLHIRKIIGDHLIKTPIKNKDTSH